MSPSEKALASSIADNDEQSLYPSRVCVAGGREEGETCYSEKLVGGCST